MLLSCSLPAEVSVNGYSAVLTRSTDVNPAVASSVTGKRHQTTSSAVLEQPQQRTNSAVTGKLYPGTGHYLLSAAEF